MHLGLVAQAKETVQEHCVSLKDNHFVFAITVILLHITRKFAFSVGDPMLSFTEMKMCISAASSKPCFVVKIEEVSLIGTWAWCNLIDHTFYLKIFEDGLTADQSCHHY